VLGGYMGSPAVNILSFSEPGGLERMRLDAGGNLLVGTTNANVYNTTGDEGVAVKTDNLQVQRANNEPLFLNRTGSDGTIANFRKDGLQVGSIGSVVGAYVQIYSNGSNGCGLTFGSGSIAPVNNSGATADNQFDLGYAAGRFDDIFATNGTIQTSDRNEKQDIEALSEAEQRVAVAAKGLLRKFRWKDSVAEKGDEARVHFGIIAQDLQAAFEAEGLDAGDYAMFISTTWTDEETNEEKTRMGVRYSELLAFIISAI